MADLAQQFLEEAAPQTAPQGAVQPANSLDQLDGLVQTPMDSFMLTMLKYADRYGLLDTLGQPGDDVQNQLEGLGDEDILAYLSKEEIDELVTKFEAIPPDQQETLLNAVKQESPETYKSILARVRLVRGRNNVVSQHG